MDTLFEHNTSQYTFPTARLKQLKPEYLGHILLEIASVIERSKVVLYKLRIQPKIRFFEVKSYVHTGHKYFASLYEHNITSH